MAASMNGHLVPPPCGPVGFRHLWCSGVLFGDNQSDFGLLVYEIRPPVGLACRWLIDHSMMTAWFFFVSPVFPCGPVGCWRLWSAGMEFRDFMTIKPGLDMLLYDVPLLWGRFAGG